MLEVSGKRNCEAHFTAFTIAHIDTSAVALDDMLADGKAKTGRDLPASVPFHPEKAFKYTEPQLRRYAWAFVHYAEQCYALPGKRFS